MISYFTTIDFALGLGIGAILAFVLPYLLSRKKKYDLSALNKITANIEINLKNAYDDIEKLAGYFKELEKG